MHSVFKLSLLAATFAFAVPNMASAAPAKHHVQKQHKVTHHKGKKVKGKKLNSHYRYQPRGDQETNDLNARSLQSIQPYNNGQAVPTRQGNVVIAPGTGNTVAPPSVPAPPSAGAVNPNNMPPSQY